MIKCEILVSVTNPFDGLFQARGLFSLEKTVSGLEIIKDTEKFTNLYIYNVKIHILLVSGLTKW